jgi:hypothetical protein
VNITFQNEQYGKHEWLSFKVDKMPTTEAEAIEGVTGKTFVEWGQALLNGSTICGRALVWVMLKRHNPALRFKEVSYMVGDLKVDLDDDEKAKMRVELMRNEDLSEEDKQQILAALGDEDTLEALDFEPDGPGNGESATGSDAASA